MKSATERMTELLKEKGKSEKGLAEYLGVPINTVRQWKYHLNTPPRKHIEKIAEYIGVSVTLIMTGVPNLKEDEIPNDILELVELYCSLNVLRKSEIVSYMKTLVRR